MKQTCSIIIPLHNEQDGIRHFHERLCETISTLAYTLEFIYVDDGSTDQTIEYLNEIAEQETNVTIISLSRNFGHQAALTAGIDYATGAVVITMDGDGQHPPDMIPAMIDLYEGGYDIVMAQRTILHRQPLLKRTMSELFYHLINWLGDTEIAPGVADFRLMSRSSVESLKQMPEQHRFLRGMVSWMGYKTAILPYNEEERLHGTPKYTLKRSWKLARDGIFSFSTFPLKLSFLVGAGF